MDLKQNIFQLLNNNFSQFKSINKFYNEEGQGKSWDDLLSDILVNYFQLKNLGFKKGDRLLLISPDSYEALVLILTSAFAGFVYVPVFMNFSNHHYANIIRYISPKAIYSVTELELPDDLPQFQVYNFAFSKNLTEQKMKEAIYDFETVSSEDSAAIYLTSGTTGSLKGVELTQRNIVHQVLSHKDFLNVTSDDRLFVHLPWYHCYGGILELYSLLYAGAEIHISTKGAGHYQDFYRLVKTIKPTLVYSVPRIFRKLFETAKNNNELSEIFHKDLRYMFSGGAFMHSQIYEDITNCNIPVYQGYGQTEASPGITCPDTSKPCGFGTVGVAVPDCEVKISENGELLAKGDNVMKGYWKDDNLTKEKIDDDGWLHTGDLCYIADDGYHITGRVDDIIKLDNGRKVHAPSIESELCKLNGVFSAVVGEEGAEALSAILFVDKNVVLNDNLNIFRNQIYKINNNIDEKFSHIKAVKLVYREPSVLMNELTPSMKLIRKNIFANHCPQSCFYEDESLIRLA